MTKVTKQKSKTATKKAAPKKKAPAITVPSTTIRMIEDQEPCQESYFAFLWDFGGEPLDTDVRYPGWKAKRGTKTRIGPDTPIPLTEILHGKSSDIPGIERVQWIVAHECVIAGKALGDLMTRVRAMNRDALALNMLLTLDAATIEKLLA